MKRLAIAALFAALLLPLPAGARDHHTHSNTAPATSSDSSLIEQGSYVNSQGNVVHSPAHTQNGQKPDGATAHCRDGTWSFSQSRRGTCSHHGGVAEWE